MSTRVRTFVIVGAILGAAVGLVYVFRYDPLCASQAIESAGGSCQHDEIFGWQPGSLAAPIWTLIGLVGGGLVGWVAAGPMTRIRWLVIGVAAVVSVVLYFALVYTPDPGFDF
jgi:uncharacterized membrane protein YuzA (DUF378 family)